MVSFYAKAIIAEEKGRKLYNLKGKIKEQVREYCIAEGYSFDENEELVKGTSEKKTTAELYEEFKDAVHNLKK